MGINPMGSNKKPRSTIIFVNKTDQQIYKNGIADVAEANRMSPSETVLSLVLDGVAKTERGQAVARTLYSSDSPSCLEAYASLFEELSALGERSRDALPVIDSFLKYTLDYEACIDTTNPLVHHLGQQWDSVAEALEVACKNGEADTALAAKDARELVSVISYESAMQSFASLVSLIVDNFDVLRVHSCTYRVLNDLASLGFPTRRGVRETASTRLALLRTVDTYYAGGEGANL